MGRSQRCCWPLTLPHPLPAVLLPQAGQQRVGPGLQQGMLPSGQHFGQRGEDKKTPVQAGMGQGERRTLETASLNKEQIQIQRTILIARAGGIALAAMPGFNAQQELEQIRWG